jgi:predicted ATPase
VFFGDLCDEEEAASQSVVNQQELEAQLKSAFEKLFGIFSELHLPIVFFLDDLQWVDSGSKMLLQSLFSSSSFKGVFLGSFRDNEVKDEAHPLSLMLEDIRKQNLVDVKSIQLKELSLSETKELVNEIVVGKWKNDSEVDELAKRVVVSTR